jgi:phosphoglycolate phosphatase-like HAD superfamily hydrolase
MAPVILWDIDGTLVRSNGGRVSLNAFLRAVQRAAELDSDLPYPPDLGGKTDQQIVFEVLAALDIAEDRATEIVARFGAVYLSELEQHTELLTSDLRILPGVTDVLARLHALGITQTLLTGNLEPIARLKLICAGLDRYVDFELGAYGSDHRDRTCLVPITRQRLFERLGAEVPAGDVEVIGDTPRDIACARAGGAQVVAVATGQFTRAMLAEHQPDLLLEDLSDADAVVEAVLSLASAIQ